MFKRNLMVTGGYGFIGFNFIFKMIELYPYVNIINVDNETYAAKYLLKEKKKLLKALAPKKDNISKSIPHFAPFIKNVKCDINNFKKLARLVEQYNIDAIVNFAAESHVDNSIKNPDIFIKSNINGTFTLLEIAKKYNLRYHQVSTDEVYGPVDPYNDIVDENFKYNPSSPYSSSKASADLLVLAYVKTFGVNATITRCTNNYGPWQHNEKLIPLVITNALQDKSIPVYGNGKQIRNWIYVDDHCSGIIDVLTCDSVPGQIFNIGSKTLITNIDLIKKILRILNKPESLITYVADRTAHDFAYHLCSDKISTKFNWEEYTGFDEGLKQTIEFYNS